MKKPRYQNEDIMKALGIKTKEERYAYNIALIDEANGYTDDELEGYYRCLWKLTTEEDDFKWRMCAKAYEHRAKLQRTLPDRLIVTKAEKRRFLHTRKKKNKTHRKILRKAWRAVDGMTEEELEQKVYEDQIWFEQRLAEYEAEKETAGKYNGNELRVESTLYEGECWFEEMMIKK